MRLPPPTKSAYRCWLDGDFPKIVNAMRECETERGLQAVWAAKQPVIVQMPDFWIAHLEEEYERLIDWLRHVNGRR